MSLVDDILHRLRRRSAEGDYGLPPIERAKVVVDLLSINPAVEATDKFPVSQLTLNLETGPWIAGGAPLRWFLNEPVLQSDIDVFCANEDQARQILNKFDNVTYKSSRYEYVCRLHYKSTNALTFKIKQTSASKYIPFSANNIDEKEWTWTVQVIIRRYFKNLDELLNNFDIRACRVATDGDTIVFADESVKQDIMQRRLVMDQPLTPDALKRLYKYLSYGFKPTPELIDKFLADPQIEWHLKPGVDGEEYDNAF